MKTRNLLLAGLAAFAMASCSSNDEFVDNQGQTPVETDATMQINFSFPQGAANREAVNGKDAGEGFEYNVSTITAILVYGETNKVIVTKDIDVIETPGAGQVVTVTTEPFAVAAGKATVYAVINKGDIDITPGNYLDVLVGNYDDTKIISNSFNYLTGTIAKTDNFLMSGYNRTEVSIETGKTATATIDVKRVSAKLDEKTSSDPKDLKDTKIVTEDGSSIAVKIQKYAYINLSENSYVFGNKRYASLAPLQKYTGGDKDYKFISNTANNPTYCLENIREKAWEGSSWSELDKPSTSVLYQGQVCLKKDQTYTDLTSNFYIKAEFFNNTQQRTLYKNYANLQAKYPSLPADEKDLTAAIMKANGIMQYAAGICYYGSTIKDMSSQITTTDIIRNNWYQLNVSAIRDLGYPTPVPPTPEKEAMLKLEVNIQPWNIQVNEIIL